MSSALGRFGRIRGPSMVLQTIHEEDVTLKLDDFDRESGSKKPEGYYVVN